MRYHIITATIFAYEGSYLTAVFSNDDECYACGYNPRAVMNVVNNREPSHRGAVFTVVKRSSKNLAI